MFTCFSLLTRTTTSKLLPFLLNNSIHFDKTVVCVHVHTGYQTSHSHTKCIYHTNSLFRRDVIIAIIWIIFQSDNLCLSAIMSLHSHMWSFKLSSPFNKTCTALIRSPPISSSIYLLYGPLTAFLMGGRQTVWPLTLRYSSTFEVDWQSAQRWKSFLTALDIRESSDKITPSFYRLT